MEWTEVFNVIDESMSRIISKNLSLFLPEKPTATGVEMEEDNDMSYNEATPPVKESICILLRFTVSMLDNAINKELYNSVEVIIHV